MIESSIPSSLFTYSVIHTRTDSWLLTLYFGLQSDISLGGLFLCLGAWRGCCWCLLKPTRPGSGELLQLSPVSLGMLSSLWDCFLFRHFLAFWHSRCSRLILYIPCSRTRIRHFSRGSGSFWNGIRNQYLGIGCACSCWAIFASGHSQLTEEGNVCILTCVYSHTSKCFYM